MIEKIKNLFGLNDGEKKIEGDAYEESLRLAQKVMNDLDENSVENYESKNQK